ncbi:MAG: hypothetical protein ACRED5_03755 [Propylenella sp.]
MIPPSFPFADLDLEGSFLTPVIDLVHEELEGGTCPVKLAVILQTLALAAARYDPEGGDDFVTLLTQEMREVAKDLAS